MKNLVENYDIVVVGAGHAGCEAALAGARLGLNTIMFTVSVDSIALMPCKRIVLLPERAEEFEAEEFEADELDEAAVLPLPFFRGGSKYFTPSLNSSLPRNCFLFSSKNS